MLKRIRIQNFQRHAKLDIEFDPAVTTIVGQTDAGKSAVLRALRWLALNQPQGDAFVRDGSKGTTVKLAVDGRVIVRKRGGSRNDYWLDKSKFKAFGSGVPGPIEDVLKLAEINFARQLDPPFWLAETPGEVARRLNAVVDLGVIDRTMSAIGKAVRKSQAEADVCRDRADAARIRLNSQRWVLDAAAAFDVVEALYERKIAAHATHASVRRLVAESDRYVARKSDASRAASAGRMVVDKLDVLRMLRSRKDELALLIDNIEGLRAMVVVPVPSIERLCEADNALWQGHARRVKLRQALGEIKTLRIRIKAVKETRERFVAGLAEATEGRCPVCGGELDVQE